MGYSQIYHRSWTLHLLILTGVILWTVRWRTWNQNNNSSTICEISITYPIKELMGFFRRFTFFPDSVGLVFRRFSFFRSVHILSPADSRACCVFLLLASWGWFLGILCMLGYLFPKLCAKGEGGRVVLALQGFDGGGLWRRWCLMQNVLLEQLYGM